MPKNRELTVLHRFSSVSTNDLSLFFQSNFIILVRLFYISRAKAQVGLSLLYSHMIQTTTLCPYQPGKVYVIAAANLQYRQPQLRWVSPISNFNKQDHQYQCKSDSTIFTLHHWHLHQLPHLHLPTVTSN